MTYAELLERVTNLDADDDATVRVNGEHDVEDIYMDVDDRVYIHLE